MADSVMVMYKMSAIKVEGWNTIFHGGEFCGMETSPMVGEKDDKKFEE